jgi:hypothetical protein
MFFLRFLWLMLVSIKEYLKELRDPLANNLCVARHRQDGWLQNRADFIDNAIRSLCPAAHGLDYALDVITLLVGAHG